MHGFSALPLVGMTSPITCAADGPTPKSPQTFQTEVEIMTKLLAVHIHICISTYVQP